MAPAVMKGSVSDQRGSLTSQQNISPWSRGRHVIRSARVGGSMEEPLIPVRMNRTESLRRIHAFNADVLGNYAQPNRGEAASFVIGRNKLAAQNLRTQTGKWFRQQNLMVGKIERHQRVTYENLLRLEREKTAIKEQMRRAKEEKMEEEEEEGRGGGGGGEEEKEEAINSKDDNENKKREERSHSCENTKDASEENGEPNAEMSTSQEVGVTEININTNKICPVKIQIEPPAEEKAELVPCQGQGQGQDQGQLGSPEERMASPQYSKQEEVQSKTSPSSPREDCKKRRFVYPQIPKSAPLGSRRPRGASYPERKINTSLSSIDEERNSFGSSRSTKSDKDDKLPSIRERYRQMFEKDSLKPMPSSPCRNNKGIGKNPEAETLPVITRRQNSCGSSEGQSVSPRDSATKSSRLDLLRLLDTQQVRHQNRPITVSGHFQNEANAQTRMPANVTLSHYATLPPSERRRQILNEEVVVHYKLDYEGNIVPEDFPYRRKEFILPKKRHASFYQNLIQREENSKKSNQQQFSNLCDNLEKPDEWNPVPLEELRPADATEEENTPQNYGKLGNSLTSLFRAFKQDWDILKGLDPNSAEALRVCRYLRLKEASSTGYFDSRPLSRSLDRQVTWMA